MKINSPDKNSLIILLERADMESLQLDIDNLLYSNERTKEILWSLFCEACAELGRNPERRSNTLIEAVPFDDGGCLICFTLKDKKQKIKIVAKLKNSADIYQFESIESFKKFKSCAELANIKLAGNLYALNDTYRFITKSSELNKSAYLSEFATKISYPLAESYTKEYFTLCEAFQ